MNRFEQLLGKEQLVETYKTLDEGIISVGDIIYAYDDGKYGKDPTKEGFVGVIESIDFIDSIASLKGPDNGTITIPQQLFHGTLSSFRDNVNRLKEKASKCCEIAKVFLSDCTEDEMEKFATVLMHASDFVIHKLLNKYCNFLS